MYFLFLVSFLGTLNIWKNTNIENYKINSNNAFASFVNWGFNRMQSKQIVWKIIRLHDSIE